MNTPRPDGRIAGRFRTCAGCGDDIWPNEQVYPATADGDTSETAGVLCEVCEVKAQIAERRNADGVLRYDPKSGSVIMPNHW